VVRKTGKKGKHGDDEEIRNGDDDDEEIDQTGGEDDDEIHQNGDDDDEEIDQNEDNEIAIEHMFSPDRKEAIEDQIEDNAPSVQRVLNFNDDDEGTNEGTNEDADEDAVDEREVLVDAIIDKEGFRGLFEGFDNKDAVLKEKKTLRSGTPGAKEKFNRGVLHNYCTKKGITVPKRRYDMHTWHRFKWSEATRIQG
jgi:hypothetical protein